MMLIKNSYKLLNHEKLVSYMTYINQYTYSPLSHKSHIIHINFLLKTKGKKYQYVLNLNIKTINSNGGQ